MKVWTQEDIDAVEPDENGVKHFGESCSFGESCRFEGKFKAKTTCPFISIAGAGTARRTSYFFDFVDGIYVRSGCFFGTLEDFRNKVLKDDSTPEKNSIKTLQYLGFANIAAVTFGGETK